MHEWITYNFVSLITHSVYGIRIRSVGIKKSVISFGFVFTFLVICAALPMNAFAVGGISNSKVVVPSTDTVPKKHVEIEPFFGLRFVDDKDDTRRFGGGVRLTLGVLENLEAGLNLNYLNYMDSRLIQNDINFGDIELGVKFRFLNQGDNIPFSLIILLINICA